jgi:hypothetical protein
MSIDGGPFRPIAPQDGLLDTREERFEVALKELSAGTHIVTVRARDAAHNVGVSAVEFQVGR